MHNSGLENVQMRILQYYLKRLCEIFKHTHLKNPQEREKVVDKKHFLSYLSIDKNHMIAG